MPILFAGTEQDAVKGGEDVSTNTLFYDPAYSRSAIRISESSPASFSCQTEIVDDFWLGYTLSASSGSFPLSGTALKLINANNEVSLIIEVAGANSIATIYNTENESSNSIGFTWVGNNIITRYDFHIYNLAGNGVVDCYVDDNLKSTGTITGLHRPIKHVEILGPSQNGNAYVSEIICGDENILSMRVKTLPPIADGTNTAWSGSYIDISGVTPSTASIGSVVPNDIETYLHDAINAGTTIKAVVIGASIAGGSANGVTALLGNLEKGFNFPLSTGFNQNLSIFEINPDTGLGYTAEELNSMEFGLVNKA